MVEDKGRRKRFPGFNLNEKPSTPDLGVFVFLLAVQKATLVAVMSVPNQQRTVIGGRVLEIGPYCAPSVAEVLQMCWRDV